MALSDKNILITPNIGAAADPKIVFAGADAATAAQTITLNVYPTSSGTLSFEGSAGQLFSITNSLSGTIYSVNDVSGIPSIEVLDTGLVKLAQYSGNVVLGSATDTGLAKLQVTGNITQNGNQVLHAGNYNTYSPTLTGTGASGSWGISVTGNAATLSNFAVSNTVNGSITVANNYIGYISDYSGTALTASVADGALYNQFYSTSWQHQIYGDYRSGQIALRGKNNGTWQAWRTVVDSGNYNNYSPTLTGTGASGSWSISVTGNAATATTWQTARTLTIGSTGKSLDGSAAVTWTLAEIGAYAATNPTGYLTSTLGNTAITGFKTATFNSQTVIATTTGAITLDWTTAQNQKQIEPTGAITYTFTAPPGVCHLQLLIDSDGTSTAQTFTWPGTVIWMGATWVGVANKKAIINFWYDGTNYYAMGTNQV